MLNIPIFFSFKVIIKPNDPSERILTAESKDAIKHWLMDKNNTRTKQICKFHHKSNREDGQFSGTERASVSSKEDAVSPLVEESLGVPLSPNKVESLQIKRLEKKLSELDQKLDVLIESMLHSRRSKSPE
jgi:hypothetical protein